MGLVYGSTATRPAQTPTGSNPTRLATVRPHLPHTPDQPTDRPTDRLQGSSLKSTTRPKTLALDTHEALSTRWGVPKEDIPKVCLTMGIGTMRAAKDVLVMFNGSSRARALEAALEKGVNHMFPVVRWITTWGDQHHRPLQFNGFRAALQTCTLDLHFKPPRRRPAPKLRLESSRHCTTP